MGCFKLKGKPCAVIAHVIDQDIEPEEWAEVYEALSNAHALRKQGRLGGPEETLSKRQGSFRTRRPSAYQQVTQEEGNQGSRDDVTLEVSQDEGVQLRMLRARGRKKEVEIYASKSPEADPLVTIEAFGWNKDSGLRLRSAKTGKLLMTLVPIKRPSQLRPVVLPQECQLPGMDKEELASSWELCRVYADGRVVASVRCCSNDLEKTPSSCWGDPLRRRQGPRLQTFRIWVAAKGAIQAACSRCPSFRTDASSHELTVALSRGLGVSGFDSSHGGKKRPWFGSRSGLQREMGKYWEDVALARRKSVGGDSGVEGEEQEGERARLEGEGGVLAGPLCSEEVLATNSDALLGVPNEGVVLDRDTMGEDALGGATNRDGTDFGAREGEVFDRAGVGHSSRRSLDSVGEYFECRSGRNSESGSEADGGARLRESKSLGLENDQADIPSGVMEERLELALQRSKSVGFHQGGAFGSERRSQSNEVPMYDGSRMDADNVGDDGLEKLPPKRIGMLEAFLSSPSGNKDELREELQEPLLQYRSSGLEYDPLPDVGPLQHQGSLVPSAFNTSAMVPLTVELTRASLGKVDIVLRNAGSDLRLGDVVAASAGTSGFGCGRRMNMKVAATCPVDVLALAMLAHYLGGHFYNLQ